MCAEGVVSEKNTNKVRQCSYIHTCRLLPRPNAHGWRISIYSIHDRRRFRRKKIWILIPSPILAGSTAVITLGGGRAMDTSRPQPSRMEQPLPFWLPTTDTPGRGLRVSRDVTRMPGFRRLRRVVFRREVSRCCSDDPMQQACCTFALRRRRANITLPE